eukprot:jgi/Botrbrau1/3712/Bobra.0008s0037.1
MSLDRFQDLSGISSSKSHDQYGQTPGIMRVLFGMGKRFPCTVYRQRCNVFKTILG